MLATASAQDDASWIEALDPASGKKCAPDHVVITLVIIICP